MSENGARRNDWTALVQRCPNRCGGDGRKPNRPRGLSRPAGRKPPYWAVERPARPYKTAMQNRFTVVNAKGASPPRVDPDLVVIVLRWHGRPLRLHA